jgi:dihydrofolate synthase/folylpolyglutamate synthase
LLGDPQAAYRVIHITGTNGKTSTARLIERLLSETGLRTGRFTSPHLVTFNERISIDGEPVSNEILVEIWNEIEPVLELVDAQLEAEGETKLTFFEALAVLGFAIFADAPIDVLVLEVGMGGEWDSTNVADGDVAVFAPIALDHTDRIGANITEIAQTKSGIIKPGSIVVSSAQLPEAEAVLRKKSAELGVEIHFAGDDFQVLDSTPTKTGQQLSVRSLTSKYADLQLPLHGDFQAENAALALAAVEAFWAAGNSDCLMMLFAWQWPMSLRLAGSRSSTLIHSLFSMELTILMEPRQFLKHWQRILAHLSSLLWFQWSKKKIQARSLKN